MRCDRSQRWRRTPERERRMTYLILTVIAALGLIQAWQRRKA